MYIVSILCMVEPASCLIYVLLKEQSSTNWSDVDVAVLLSSTMLPTRMLRLRVIYSSISRGSDTCISPGASWHQPIKNVFKSIRARRLRAVRSSSTSPLSKAHIVTTDEGVFGDGALKCYIQEQMGSERQVLRTLVRLVEIWGLGNPQ